MLTQPPALATSRTQTLSRSGLWCLAGLGVIFLMGCQPLEPEERWVPFGEREANHIVLSRAAREFLNQFPLVQILDEHLDLTVNIVWFDVRDEDGEEFVLFYRYWDGTWIKRTRNSDGSNNFEPYP